MKCVISKDVLLEPALRAEKVTGKNHTLPVLSCLHLSVTNTTLTITATNLEVGVSYNLPINSGEPGAVAISGAVFVQLLSTLPTNASVSLSTITGHLVIESVGTVAKIALQNTEEFPVLPKVESGTTSVLSSKAMFDALATVSFCASNSTIKPELSSVFFHLDGTTLITAATDSFRLAEKRIPLKKSVSTEPILIPIRSVPDLMKMLENAPDEVTLLSNDHQLSITTPSVYITLRLVAGTFPDYTQIIPKEFVTEITTLRFDIERILRRAAVFADQFNQTTFHIKPKKKTCTIHTQHTAIGETTDELHTTLHGEELRVSFNQRYLLDALHSIVSDSILIQFSGQSQPAIIRPVGDTTYLYLVMPMNR